MIYATQVNYNWKHIFTSFFIGQNTGCQDQLIQLLTTYFATDNISLTSSGRSALYFTLLKLPQQKVFIPAYTCASVTQAAVLAEKDVIFVRSDDHSVNITPESLQEVIEPNSIVIAVHQYGIPCQIHRIKEICDNNQCFLIEDIAASFGSTIQGQLTGTFADAAIFSFDTTKLLNAPLKGGGFIIKNDELYIKIRNSHTKNTQPVTYVKRIKLLFLASCYLVMEIPVLRYFPLLFRHFRVERKKCRKDSPPLSPFSVSSGEGYYSLSFSNWQAFFVLLQMRRIESITKRRIELYQLYQKNLGSLKSISILPEDKSKEWVICKFPIFFKSDSSREVFFQNALKSGLDLLDGFAIACPTNFEATWKQTYTVLILPFHHNLSKSKLHKIFDLVRELDT